MSGCSGPYEQGCVSEKASELSLTEQKLPRTITKQQREWKDDGQPRRNPEERSRRYVNVYVQHRGSPTAKSRIACLSGVVDPTTIDTNQPFAIWFEFRKISKSIHWCLLCKLFCSLQSFHKEWFVVDGALHNGHSACSSFLSTFKRSKTSEMQC